MSARFLFAGALAMVVACMGFVSVGEAQIRESRKPPPAKTAPAPQPAPKKTAPSPVTQPPPAAPRAAVSEPEMVRIPGGSFVMGSPASEAGRGADEGPQRTVSVRAFEVGKYEVTFAQWDACVADGGCGGHRPADQGWGRGRQPLINVSWNDAQEYVQWLSRRTGKSYRLLTEAEWEYAARAGTTNPYPWGSTASHEYANYGAESCCSGLASGRDQWVNTAPVGSFGANGFGLHDMHGNVWEWVEDCYKENYSGAPADGSSFINQSCSSRVLRGGSWYYGPRYLRSADRYRDPPSNRFNDVGFRLARTL
jgi:formylglycine-generating enzyme required for sulfatase activity